MTLFLPFQNCCLIKFLQFYQSLVLFERPAIISEHLSDFKQGFQQLQKSSSSDEVIPLPIIELIVSSAIIHFLHHQKSHLLMGKFLQHLNLSNITPLFSTPGIFITNITPRPLPGVADAYQGWMYVSVPNIEVIHQLHCITAELKISLDYSSLSRDEQSFQVEAYRVLDELQKQGYYNEARVFASIAKQDPDSITIKQVGFCTLCDFLLKAFMIMSSWFAVAWWAEDSAAKQSVAVGGNARPFLDPLFWSADQAQSAAVCCQSILPGIFDSLPRILSALILVHLMTLPSNRSCQIYGRILGFSKPLIKGISGMKEHSLEAWAQRFLSWFNAYIAKEFISSSGSTVC